MDYLISSIDSYSALDGFCDENGELNSQMPRANWYVTFSDLCKNALVQTIVTYKPLESHGMVIQVDMKEGLESTLERLDELLQL